MRVLHIANHLNSGGISSYILKLAGPMRELGIETEVLAAGGEWKGLFEEKGIRTHALPFRTKSILHPMIYFYLPFVLDMVHKRRIHLIHAHTRIGQAIAFWIQAILRVPVVTTCHGFFKPKLGRKVFPAWGNTVIAISEPVRRMLVEQFGVPDRKIRRILNGIDLADMDQRLRMFPKPHAKGTYGFGGDTTVIGITGRLVPMKGHRILIEALGILKPEYPSIRAIIAGSGPEYENLSHQVRELGLSKDVRFTGAVADISGPLSAMDIYALPLTDYEGFGLGPIEAMAAGIPVISSPMWALASELQNPLRALITEAEPQQVADAIRNLIRDKELYKSLAIQGRLFVEKACTLSRMAREVAEAYQELGS